MHTDLISRLQNARTGIHIAAAIGTDKALTPAINELLDAAKEAEIALATPQPEAKAGADDWRHIANEWADVATNGPTILRNVRNGLLSVDDAIASMETDFRRVRAAQPKPAEGAEAARTVRPNDGEVMQHDAGQVPDNGPVAPPPVSDTGGDCSKVVEGGAVGPYHAVRDDKGLADAVKYPEDSGLAQPKPAEGGAVSFDDEVISCDVKVAPATTFRAGVKLSTVIAGIRLRAGGRYKFPERSAPAGSGEAVAVGVVRDDGRNHPAGSCEATLLLPLPIDTTLYAGAAPAVDAEALVIEPTHCGCHPETCGCGDYTLRIGETQITTGTKQQLCEIAAALGRLSGA